MRNIAPETTIGEIVRALPATSRIFENLNIDYCCGGKKSLAEACRSRGLDAATVIAMLSALDQPANGAPANADAMALAELCDHIQQTHHAYLQEELPRLDFMTRKVAAVHGEHEPRLLELRQTFEIFNGEMTTHTKEEDEIIFPAIRQLEAATNGRPAASPHLRTTLTRLEREHDSAGAALEQFLDLDGQLHAAGVGLQHLPRPLRRAGAVGEKHAPARAQGKQRALSTGTRGGHG